MSTESQLREKLRKIEALFAGAGTTGERLAAEAALERVRARLSELGQKDPPVETQFSMPDQWSRHLFLALCRRYGLSPYRLHRQQRNSVMVFRQPRGFVDHVLWREFGEAPQWTCRADDQGHNKHRIGAQRSIEMDRIFGAGAREDFAGSLGWRCRKRTDGDCA